MVGVGSGLQGGPAPLPGLWQRTLRDLDLIDKCPLPPWQSQQQVSQGSAWGEGGGAVSSPFTWPSGAPSSPDASRVGRNRECWASIMWTTGSGTSRAVTGLSGRYRSWMAAWSALRNAGSWYRNLGGECGGGNSLLRELHRKQKSTSAWPCIKSPKSLRPTGGTQASCPRKGRSGHRCTLSRVTCSGCSRDIKPSRTDATILLRSWESVCVTVNSREARAAAEWHGSGRQDQARSLTSARTWGGGRGPLPAQ